MNWLVARPIAHRGWHGPGRPENSAAAAEAAAEAGYAVECDVVLSADGEAMVFHDSTLERLTGASGPVAARDAAALSSLTLAGTAERIPRLSDFLGVIDARTPLICEIKSAFDGQTALAARAAQVAATYPGPLAFKSFDPAVIAFLRAAACPRPLGLVAQASYNEPYFAALSPAQKREAADLTHWERTRPDFLSWCVDDLPHATPVLARALGPLPVMAWTVRTPAQWALARAYADQAVFEGALA